LTARRACGNNKVVHMDTKLVRVDEKVFEELHAVAGKLQIREGRRVSINGALRALLFTKNERSAEEKTFEFHPGTNLKHEKKTLRTLKNASQHEPLKRFSLRHKKFVPE
jgi:hypothetical protein